MIVKIKAELTVEVELNGVDTEEVKTAIRTGIQRMFGEGAVTGESEAEVETWELEVNEFPQPSSGCHICGSPDH